MTHHLPLTPETVAGSTVILASVTNFLSDKDWERMIGPWGGLLISVAMLGILLRHSAARIKKDDKRAEEDKADRDKRHAESMEIQKSMAKRLDEQTQQLMGLTVEGIKAQARSTVAVESVDRTMQNLTMRIMERPCQADTFKTPMPVEKR